MQSPSRRLGEFLVERKVLSRDVLEDALTREERDGVPLAKLLIGEGLVGERDLVAGLAYQLGIPFLDFEQQPVNPSSNGWCQPNSPGATSRWRYPRTAAT